MTFPTAANIKNKIRFATTILAPVGADHIKGTVDYSDYECLR